MVPIINQVQPHWYRGYYRIGIGKLAVEATACLLISSHWYRNNCRIQINKLTAQAIACLLVSSRLQSPFPSLALASKPFKQIIHGSSAIREHLGFGSSFASFSFIVLEPSHLAWGHPIQVELCYTTPQFDLALYLLHMINPIGNQRCLDSSPSFSIVNISMVEATPWYDWSLYLNMTNLIGQPTDILQIQLIPKVTYVISWKLTP